MIKETESQVSNSKSSSHIAYNNWKWSVVYEGSGTKLLLAICWQDRS